jgi:hypothetical protein
MMHTHMTYGLQSCTGHAWLAEDDELPPAGLWCACCSAGVEVWIGVQAIMGIDGDIPPKIKALYIGVGYSRFSRVSLTSSCWACTPMAGMH